MPEGFVFWLTGLSGAGKTTLARAVHTQLQAFDRPVRFTIIDGDLIRKGLCSDLGFSLADREENIRRVAELSRILTDCGIHCINCFISPTQSIREKAKKVIGPDRFREIYIRASVACCEERDVKGLYSLARAGQIGDFTGIQSPYEEPVNPDLIIDTEFRTLEESIQLLYTYIHEIAG